MKRVLYIQMMVLLFFISKISWGAVIQTEVEISGTCDNDTLETGWKYFAEVHKKYTADCNRIETDVVVEAIASAEPEGVNDWRLGVWSFAYSEDPDGETPDSEALAMWSDTLFIKSALPISATAWNETHGLVWTFLVTGDMEAYGDANASLEINATTGIDPTLPENNFYARAEVENCFWEEGDLSVYYEHGFVDSPVYYDDEFPCVSGDRFDVIEKFQITGLFEQLDGYTLMLPFTIKAETRAYIDDPDREILISNSYADSNFFHTMIMDSITTRSGITPESLGYEISFESGIRSPNLTQTTIPANSTLSLLGFGLVAIGYHKRRKLKGRGNELDVQLDSSASRLTA